MDGKFSKKRLGEILAAAKRQKLTKGLTPVKVRSLCEDLGPTFVKFGQIMSMRSDIIPEEYCRELSKLRTEVKPMSFSEVTAILRQELEKSGCSPDEFSEIDPLPLGSASIAQVHRARLKNGDPVVIKIQRPNIREMMADDIALLRKAAGILKIATGTGDVLDLQTILDELWRTSQEEMNFRKEGAHLETFYKNQEEIKYASCPKVYENFTTNALLVMEYIDGIPIDDSAALAEAGYDIGEIASKTAENYCKQILEDGFFHADPHPGNIWIAEGKIFWLDLGMMGHLSAYYRRVLRNAITAILQNDMYSLKNAVLLFGEPKAKINHAVLYTDIDDIVGRYMSMGIGSMNLGQLTEDLLELLKKHEIAISSEITMLARSMVTIQGTLSLCSPDTNLIEILSNHMAGILQKEFNLQKELRRNFINIYSSAVKSTEIPSQLSDLLKIAKNGQIKISTEHADGADTRKAFYKISRKICSAWIASAFMISAAIFSLSGIRPLIFSMPWPAFACLAAGTLLAAYALFSSKHKQ
ncbi:MAG: ABC1 kinase family protein [Clostridia bacterium]